MIIDTFLPLDWDDKFHRIDAATLEWNFVWECTGAPRLRIYANMIDPWGERFHLRIIQKRSHTARVVNRIDLKCYPVKEYRAKGEGLVVADIQLDTPFGGIPFSGKPTLRFYAIPYEESNFAEYLYLSIYEPRAAEGIPPLET